MLWISLLIVHLIGLVGYTLLLRKSALSAIDKVLLAALMQTAVFVPVLAVIFFTGGINFHLAGWQWGSLLLSALLLVAIQISSINALKHLEASVWTIIYNLRLFLTTITGYLVLGELPTFFQLIGGAVIFASIVALNLHRKRRFATQAVLVGLLATVIFSVHATVEKFNIIHVGFLQYMLISGGLATILLWVWVWYRRLPITQITNHFDKHTLQLLFYRSLSAWGYVLALKFGSLAVTNYVSGMSVPLTVLLGVYILKERNFLREKITATAIAVAGLTLILISRLLHI